ncbi:MAG: hypothetical protein GF381_00355 [Candidatus Pacebacteria bacterium]|nr:hypothetical protein [Candidatus Paceibacterota bacterium]
MLYPQKMFLWPFKKWHAKNDQAAISELCQKIQTQVPHAYCVVSIGDSPNDIKFGQEIATALEAGFVGYKLRSVFDVIPPGIRSHLPM